VLPLKDNIPTRRPAVLTIAIIVICCVAYFGLQRGGINGPSDQGTVKYALIPYEVTHPGDHCDFVPLPDGSGGVACEGQPGVTGKADAQPATLLTILFAMFMHGGLLHLGGNMLFLWIFGNNVEDSMGRFRFAAFYLLGGLAATLAQVAVDPSSTTPTLGASGAIAAVLGGYALLYPRARVVTLIFIIIFVTVIELPALLVLGAWFLFQLADASSQPLHGGGGVAYFAHIGGFVFGLLVIRLFANNPNRDYDRQARIPVY
jgi:membrane associated rhomboid family serine protease